MKRRGGTVPRNPREPLVRAAFVRVLADLREKAGLTQEQVGEKSGYEQEYIGALERRKHTPTLTAVIQCCQCFSFDNSRIGIGTDSEVCSSRTKTMTANSQRSSAAYQLDGDIGLRILLGLEAMLSCVPQIP